MINYSCEQRQTRSVSLSEFGDLVLGDTDPVLADRAVLFVPANPTMTSGTYAQAIDEQG